MEEIKAPNHVKTRDPLEKKSDEPAITMTVGQTMTFGSRLNNSPNRIQVQAPENEDNIVEDNGILTMIQEHKDNQVNDRTFMDSTWIVFGDYYVAFWGLLLYLDSFRGLLLPP
jgi:hypothetical protein